MESMLIPMELCIMVSQISLKQKIIHLAQLYLIQMMMKVFKIKILTDSIVVKKYVVKFFENLIEIEIFIRIKNINFI